MTVPAFVRLELLDGDALVADVIARVRFMARGGSSGVVIHLARSPGVTCTAARVETVTSAGNKTLTALPLFTSGLMRASPGDPAAGQRSVQEELRLRWPDAGSGVVRIAEGLLDEWALSLDELRVAAVALDIAGAPS